MKATIKTVFTLVPERVSFTGYETKGGDQTVTVKHTDGKTFKLLGLEAKPDYMEVSSDPAWGTAITEGQTATLSLKVKPDAPTGNLSSKITIKTDVPDMPLLVVDAFVRMNPLVSAIPNQVRMTIRTQAYQARVKDVKVSIHKEPQADAEVIHVAEPGTTLNVRETRDGWYKIWIPGVGEGWIEDGGVDPV